jgi:DNA (cytosine-5)-methyltransferase 1
MRYGSVCSGIEAATSAWHSLGWTPQWFSEIEPFPSAVLAHHYPNVPNFGDMTKFKEWKLDDSTAIDVLVGGTPCQSFSVAGLRKGLDDPRGNLMLTYLAIARKYRPRWLVWENVPGVLSSSGGEDFASLLRGMGELGYGFAYRVLDAQYFGVAQRRRRVFVVGCLGDWRAAAAVLFERHSLSGHPAPSRKARKSPPGFFESSLAQYRQADVGGTLKASGGVLSGGSETFIKTQWPAEIAPTLNAKYGEKMGLENQHIDGGAGMFTLQPIALAENTIGRQPENGGNGDGFTVGGPMYTLNATGVHGVAQPYSIMPMNSGKDYKARETDVAQPLMAGGPVGGNQGGDFIVQPVYELHGQDSRVTELKDVCNTVSAAYGAGGGNIPVTVQPVPFKETADCLTAAYGTKWNGNASADNGSLFVQHPVAFNFAPGKGELKDDIHITTANVSKTIDASGSNPAMHQGGTGVVQSVSACDVADTLTVGANQMTGFIGDVVAQRVDTMAFPWQSALDPIGKPTDVSGTLIKNQTMAVAYAFEPGIARREGGESRFVEEMSPTLRSGMGDNQVAAGYEIMDINIQPMAFTSKGNGDCFESAIHPTLSTGGGQAGQGYPAVRQGMAVRRLTPIECERLQGFPDNHTNIPWRKKPESPDGPRYKALGNSMAVPVMHWIGQRIQMVEDL